ncbi:MAG: hypothetical protein M3O30_01635 [Planctomycetota bacterium]|nr:hypothetical protein [Planctomycetota bacterium]
MADIWSQILADATYIRDIFKKHKIALKPGEGLTLALEEAEACANGVSKSTNVEDGDIVGSVNACHAVLSLCESLKACISGGMDVNGHLRQLTTGMVDFGVPEDAAIKKKKIFFKDFEAELFVAGQLVKGGLPVEFLQSSNDPRGEMRIGRILIEVKHPNSSKGGGSLMQKFNGGLERENAYGVFVTALEDAFCLADQSTFGTQEEFNAWQIKKRAAIETFGRNAVLCAALQKRIMCLVQTTSALEIVGDVTRFARYSNSLVFDNRICTDDIIIGTKKIASVFNPNFRIYSQVLSQLSPSGKAQEEGLSSDK